MPPQVSKIIKILIRNHFCFQSRKQKCLPITIFIISDPWGALRTCLQCALHSLSPSLASSKPSAGFNLLQSAHHHHTAFWPRMGLPAYKCNHCCVLVSSPSSSSGTELPSGFVARTRRSATHLQGCTHWCLCPSGSAQGWQPRRPPELSPVDATVVHHPQIEN